MLFRLSAATAAAAALVGGSALAQQAQPQSPFPPGDGRDLVAKTCTQCHAPTVFTPLREGPDAWREHITDMMMFGAQIGPDDLDKMVTYLATNFGPGVNVPPPQKEVTLADGAGKDLVEKNCVLCHGLDRVTAANRTTQGWTAIVGTMKFFGAPISGDEEKTIVAYLSDKYGGKTQP
jgi:mono/diheme cytochrome c family protein